MATDTSCLFSTLRNTSGFRRKFSFLPPHGRELEIDEEFTVFGHIQEAVIHGERVSSRRHLVALEKALEGDLTLLSTPAPILLDTVTGMPVMLTSAGGVLGTLDPCWTRSISEDLLPS